MDKQTDFSPDEARVEVLWHLAEAIAFFLYEDGQTDDEGVQTLRVAQMMALRIADSMGLTATHTGNGRRFALAVDLSENPTDFLSKGLEGGQY